MFGTIVAGVDGSPHGDRAAEQAGELAALCDARLVMTYVADPGIALDNLEMLARVEHLGAPSTGTTHPSIGQVPGWFDDALRRAEGAASVREVLNTLGAQALERAEFLAKQRGAPNVECLLEDGDPASRLLNVAARESAELIVLGSRGLGRINEILLGSVSHKVTMLARCPCLIVK